MKVYFDLDGVLANFDGGIVKYCGFQPRNQEDRDDEYDDRLWSDVRKVDHYYDQLEVIPGAKEMFDYVYGILKDDCQILSGIPKPHRGITTAGEDKINWTHRMMNPDVKVNIVFREEKENFCTGLDCILVDDYSENITAWEACGGTGILHKDSATTLKRLKELLPKKKEDG